MSVCVRESEWESTLLFDEYVKEQQDLFGNERKAKICSRFFCCIEWRVNVWKAI